MTITEFLLARIADDEATVAYPLPHERSGGYSYADVGGLSEVLTVGTDRVLAECTAKRALSNLHSPGEYRGQLTCNDCGDWWDGAPIDYPCNTIKIVAAIYSNHPDYEPAWSPNAS